MLKSNTTPQSREPPVVRKCPLPGRDQRRGVPISLVHSVTVVRLIAQPRVSSAANHK